MKNWSLKTKLVFVFFVVVLTCGIGYSILQVTITRSLVKDAAVADAQKHIDRTTSMFLVSTKKFHDDFLKARAMGSVEAQLVLEDFSRMKMTLDRVISPAALLTLPQVNPHLALMAPADQLVGNPGKNDPPFCFAQEGNLYVVYHKSGADIQLDLRSQTGTFAVKWWDPRKSDGGGLRDGSITRISGGDVRSLGEPPSDRGSSWAALVLLSN